MISLISRSAVASLLVVTFLTAASIIGSYLLMPPSDYLPTGNRNLVFGMMLPPPGYNLDHQRTIGQRVEADMRPYWEAAEIPPGPQRAETGRSRPAAAR